MGFLYIITNPAFPGWIKIGTTKDLTKRLQTYQTSSPHRDYEIVFSMEHPEYQIAEKRLRDTLSHFALRIRNEWYEVDVNIAIVRIQEQLDIYQYTNYTFITQ